jgi:hypothetical protein
MSVSLEHKQRMLAHLEHPMSEKITIGENETAIFTLPSGVKLSVSIDDGGLFVHAGSDDSQLRAAIGFERNCGNEGRKFSRRSNQRNCGSSADGPIRRRRPPRRSGTLPGDRPAAAAAPQLEIRGRLAALMGAGLFPDARLGGIVGSGGRI